MGIRSRTRLFAALAGLIVAVFTLIVVLWVNGEIPLIVAIGISLTFGLAAALVTHRVSAHEASKESTNGPTVYEIFPTTGLPRCTYEKRNEEEQDVALYRDHGTGLLSVFGPTKAGKSVLVKMLMADGLYICPCSCHMFLPSCKPH